MAIFGRRKPAFQLTGLVCSPDGLYDGSYVAACARWWNHQLQTHPEMIKGGYRAFTGDELQRLRGVVQPENRAAFQAVADAVSLPGRHSVAVLSLAYAFALVVEAGAGQTREEAQASAAWTQARPFTEHDLTELERHYSEEGAAREYELWAPYWTAARTVFPEKSGAKLIEALEATFYDQVDRWSAAEGFDLKRSVGAPDYSIIAFDENAGLSNFVELLFEWGGRLRLGESFLADDVDLEQERFAQNEFDPIDHFYNEAYERYVEIASQDRPVNEDIELAVRMCAAWLGDKLDGRGRLAISTAAVRGYLWRKVEKGPVDFLEPELTNAVTKSFDVGEDRAHDEPMGQTYYYAASQCMVDDVKTRLGSIGGLIQGPKSYEKALRDTTDDFDEHGFDIDENDRRLAFNFGVCLDG